jgi:hypothetical protein
MVKHMEFAVKINDKTPKSQQNAKPCGINHKGTKRTKNNHSGHIVIVLTSLWPLCLCGEKTKASHHHKKWHLNRR